MIVIYSVVINLSYQIYDGSFEDADDSITIHINAWKIYTDKSFIDLKIFFQSDGTMEDILYKFLLI